MNDILHEVEWGAHAKYVRLREDTNALVVETSDNLVDWSLVGVENAPLIPLDEVVVTLAVGASSLTSDCVIEWEKVDGEP